MERTKSIHIRLSETELKKIKKNASARHMTASEYLRGIGINDISILAYSPLINEQIRNIHECIREIAAITCNTSRNACMDSCSVMERLREMSFFLYTLSEYLKSSKGGVLTDGDNETAPD